MTIYASREAGDMAARCPRGQAFCPCVEDAEVLTTHSSNPMLVEFRDAIETGLYERNDLATLWVRLIDDGETFEDDVPGATPEQIDHARRVLTRLAALTKGATS